MLTRGGINDRIIPKLEDDKRIIIRRHKGYILLMKKTLFGLVASLLVSHIFASLPDGYTQLEWIMSDDDSTVCNTWIDSGVKGRSGLIVNADIRLRSNVGQVGIFGAYSRVVLV